MNQSGLPQRNDGETGTVGAPSYLADEAEVPKWFAQIVAYFSALPLFVTFVVGLIGFSSLTCCLLTVFLSLIK
ncbi:MAG: hypothetical protein HY862_14245 [Chloroflexi bacterium]|nr:hypothetical protein [Chloroflexota bacterium]